MPNYDTISLYTLGPHSFRPHPVWVATPTDTPVVAYPNNLAPFPETWHATHSYRLTGTIDPDEPH